MANRHRGEVEIVLNDKTYVARPTFEALVEFEDKSGTTAYEALLAVQERSSAPFKSVASAFYACIKAGHDGVGRAPSYGEIGAAIRAEGLGKFIPVYASLLVNALTSEKDLQKASAKDVEGDASGN